MGDHEFATNALPVPPTGPKAKKPGPHRFTPMAKPPRMVLTDRDREILLQVYLYRLMTREQIERLIFPAADGQNHPARANAARHRLMLLYHNRYLERIPIPVAPGAWAWRPVYRLAKKGAQVLAADQGVALAGLRYWGEGFDQDHRRTEASLFFLEHTLAINDVRIAVSRAAQARGYRVEKWVDDTQLKSQEMKDYVVVSGSTRSLKVAVIPDAYFVLHLGERRAHFFLELDRGTVTSKRWKTRVLAYKAYVESGSYQKRYQTTSLRILTVTTTAPRLAHLKKTTEHAEGGAMYWFTTLDQVTPDQILHSPIWLRAGEAIPQALIS